MSTNPHFCDYCRCELLLSDHKFTGDATLGLVFCSTIHRLSYCQHAAGFGRPFGGIRHLVEGLDAVERMVLLQPENSTAVDSRALERLWRRVLVRTPPEPHIVVRSPLGRAVAARCDNLGAAEWNKRYPVGIPVRYWSVLIAGSQPQNTKTRSEAWNLGHESVVQIDGVSGGVALTHLDVLHSVRSHPRFASRCPVVVERADTGLLEDGFCLDVSEGGMRVKGPSKLDVDDEVKLHLDFEGLDEVTIRALVRWTEVDEGNVRVSGLQLLATNEPAEEASFRRIVHEASRATA